MLIVWVCFSITVDCTKVVIIVYLLVRINEKINMRFTELTMLRCMLMLDDPKIAENYNI